MSSTVLAERLNANTMRYEWKCNFREQRGNPFGVLGVNDFLSQLIQDKCHKLLIILQIGFTM